jgi:hypothetical protein
MSKLILYHGSNILFNEVDLEKSRDKRDFGRGFYTTSIREQAEGWAKSLFMRYGGEGSFLYSFTFHWDEGLSSKVFDSLNEEWLEMVKNNRIHGGIQHGFDLVKGPVANDNTMPTIALFVDGILSLEATLLQLSYFKANDQVSLHTLKAVSFLTLESVETL